MLLLVTALSLVLAAPMSASARPRIAVTDTAPFTVQGASFLPRERITVVAQTPRRHVRAITATARGTFVIRFDPVKLGACTAYFVRATGARGSSAVRKVVPECNPLQPVDG